MEKITVNELRDKFLSEGFIAMYFCDFESGENEDIEHFHLLKPGDVISQGCAELGRIPLISEEADSILQDYLSGKPIQIYPKPIRRINNN